MSKLSAERNMTQPQTQRGSDVLLNFENPGALLFRGKKYAVNLLWLTIDDSGVSQENRSAIIKSRIVLINPDYVCERSVVIAQQGYGHLRKGHRLGMPVAAAAAADLLVGEWHGCFKAENGWWYVAVHGDAIAPDGDRFFSSEEDAYNFFMAAMERQHWPRAYAPEEWSVAGTTSEINMEKLLGGIQTTFLKPLNLNAIFGNAQNKVLFTIVIAFIFFMTATFVVAGLGTYMQPMMPLSKPAKTIEVLDPLIAPPRYVSDAFVDDSALLEIDDFPAPFLIQRCLEEFETMYAALPGWSQINISCKEGNVVGSWARQNARLADLNALRKSFNDDVTMLFDGKDTLTVTKPLVLDSVNKNEMRVLRKELLFAMLTKRLESKGKLSVSQIDQAAAEKKIDPNTGQEIIEANPARFMSVVFETPFPAYTWTDDFDIPGMKPLELTWSVKESLWTMTGLVQYQ